MKKTNYAVWYRTEWPGAKRSFEPLLSRACSGLNFRGELLPVSDTVLIRPKESHHE